MDKMIDHGETLLGSVKNQSLSLKEVKRKILSASNTLGLSSTLIRMIERRNVSDKYILYGGMIVTCIIMFLTVKYLI
jgi:Golgi SNAP receptor complex protein 2